ncbi:hypothetical protein [Paenirhodobacter populi]|uniref:Uncharacterized protein n=1 Tax=Paenirhodobacter populi TaxID=2306993 RepID=A0A443JUA4_9RHOB|nr:hypothetical protein [Sinirhodobacter populi]RWR24087.1 hypothetical protein D2T30_02990 [Sinirhodobacter populi]
MAPTTARRNPTRSEGTRPGVIWAWAVAGVILVGGLFYLVWKSQFAAAQSYLFDTGSVAEESGYCLAVAQDVVAGGPPVGSYVDEAAKFWLNRLKATGAPMGPVIVQARKRLAGDLNRRAGSNEDQMAQAMEVCSRRAVMYGMRFRAFQ